MCSPDYFVALDCDTDKAGIQASCEVPLGTASLDVAIVLGNNGSAADTPAALNFNLHDSDKTRLDPPLGADNNLNGNPDFNEAELSDAWTCVIPPLDNDTGADGPGRAVSFLSCYADVHGTIAPVLPGGLLTLATVHYNIPQDATEGNVDLRLSELAVADVIALEIVTCDYASPSPPPCSAAVVHLVSAISTATPTAVPTAVPTEVPIG